MSRYLNVLLAAALLVFAAREMRGQEFGIAQATAQAGKNGLERAWYTHVEVDSSRGEFAYLTQHVSATGSYTVYEIVSDRGKQVFTERDLDRFGTPLGKDAVKKLAQRTADDLNLIHQNAKLTTRVVPEITLYAMSDRGVVHAIDAETGRTHWVTAVGTAKHTSEAPAASDKYVAAVNGSVLTLLDNATGKVLWRQSVVGAPGAGPALSERFVFVPMIDGTIEGYDLEEMRKAPWVFQSHGRAVTQPFYTGTHLAWVTDLGHLNVAEGNENVIRYRFETRKPIAARPTKLAPDRLVVASTDGYVYCVKEERGTIVWRFSSGEPVTENPATIGDRVYVITEDMNLYALSGADGLEQWQVPGMRRFVAASSDRLYCMNELGRLTILEAASGAVIGSLQTESLDYSFENRQTDRIFIGTRSGDLQCLHETRHEWPLIHPGVLPDPKAKPADAGKKKKPAEPAKTAKPASDNPFGTDFPEAKPAAEKADSGDDPFGSGEAPPAGKPEEPSDPFSSAPATEGSGEAKPAAPAAGDDPFGFRPTPVTSSAKAAAKQREPAAPRARKPAPQREKDRAARVDESATKS